MKNVSIVIPARYASQRFPRKMLHPICGKPLIVQVYNSVFNEEFGEVIVLIDSPEVKNVLEDYNIPFINTNPQCQNGSERISSVLDKLKGDYIINVQGDEPLVTPAIVKDLANALMDSGEPVATLARNETNEEIMKNPNIVKVVLNKNSNALYFSRALIPYPRQKNKNWLAHVGMYGYTRSFLEKYSKLEDNNLEKTEKLEQLTFLYNGFNIHVKTGKYRMHGVDVPEDVSIVEDLLKKKKLKTG